MIATSVCTESAATRLRSAQPASQGWEIERAHCADLPAVKVLFRRLHDFNTALDARFALSQAWEAPFEAVMQRPCMTLSILAPVAWDRKKDAKYWFLCRTEETPRRAPPILTPLKKLYAAK